MVVIITNLLNSSKCGIYGNELADEWWSLLLILSNDRDVVVITINLINLSMCGGDYYKSYKITDAWR